MSTSTIISFEEAAAGRFHMSTTEELRQYLTDAGESFNPNDPQEKLRSLCLRLVGLADKSSLPGIESRPKNFKENDRSIMPRYRLDPNGKWGGRSWRVRIPKPEGAKYAKAELVAWDGKPAMQVPYDSVQLIPEPILHCLRDMARVSSRSTPIDSDGNFSTVWEFSNFNMEVLGVDPLTKDLAGSLTEWFQWKGPDFFRKCNTRELQTICSALGIERQIGPQGSRRSKSDEEMVGDILTFLYADANAQPADGKQAAKGG